MGSNNGLSIVVQNYKFLKILGQNWVSTDTIDITFAVNLSIWTMIGTFIFDVKQS